MFYQSLINIISPKRHEARIVVEEVEIAKQMRMGLLERIGVEVEGSLKEGSICLEIIWVGISKKFSSENMAGP